jgi:hypothetical protein
MATAASTLFDRAKRRYALVAGTDDPQLSDALLLDILNEKLREVAREGRAFREDLTLNLETDGVHTLPTRVLGVVQGTLRVNADGGSSYYTEPSFVDESRARDLYGAVENWPSGTPQYYYLRRVATADAVMELVMVPTPSQAVTSGVKASVYVTPTLIALVATNVPVQDDEETHLLKGLCHGMAEAEMTAGRVDAPILAYWAGKWEEAKALWIDQIEESQRGAVRQIHRTGTLEHAW